MSFGSAAASGSFFRVSPSDPCPCGGGRYDGCCGPILDGQAAATAERLMRSRYTAFVLGDAAHLLRTWHPRTRPDELVLDPSTRWVWLDVRTVTGGAETDETGSVEFLARSVDGRERVELHERSRFARRAGRWVYVDGVIGDAASGSAASVAP